MLRCAGGTAARRSVVVGALASVCFALSASVSRGRRALPPRRLAGATRRARLRRASRTGRPLRVAASRRMTRPPCSKSVTASARRACAKASTSPRSSRDEDSGEVPARPRGRAVRPAARADVRQGLPALLRRVPRSRRAALRRRVQLALRRGGGGAPQSRPRRSAAPSRGVQVQSRVVVLTLLGIVLVTALVIVAWTRGEPQNVTPAGLGTRSR